MAGPTRRATSRRLHSCALSVIAARADDYPSRPVRLVVGFPPGSSADITARVLGSRMSQTLGQQVVVENQARRGLESRGRVRRPRAEGRLHAVPRLVRQRHQRGDPPNLTFDFAKDFAPIARASTAAVILVVHPSTDVNSVEELIALAKSKPGEILYASTGVGTAPHLSGELFGQRAGVKLVHVPYQGSPQAATDLIAGRVHMMFSPASAVMSQVEAGKLTALASAAAKRPGIAANVPTMAEAGLPDFDTSIWFGLMAPAGTPREVVDKLARRPQRGAEIATRWSTSSGYRASSRSAAPRRSSPPSSTPRCTNGPPPPRRRGQTKSRLTNRSPSSFLRESGGSSNHKPLDKIAVPRYQRQGLLGPRFRGDDNGEVVSTGTGSRKVRCRDSRSAPAARSPAAWRRRVALHVDRDRHLLEAGSAARPASCGRGRRSWCAPPPRSSRSRRPSWRRRTRTPRHSSRPRRTAETRAASARRRARRRAPAR